uniref:Uncharacterized protein n=1 Tax=Tetranychus urticae TaxID=32264 RepID=T1K5A6_TETUR
MAELNQREDLYNLDCDTEVDNSENSDTAEEESDVDEAGRYLAGGTAKTRDGEYHWKKLVSRERVEVDSKMLDVTKVQWENSLVLNFNIKGVKNRHLKDCKYGLFAEARNLVLVSKVHSRRWEMQLQEL